MQPFFFDREIKNPKRLPKSTKQMQERQ